MDLGTEEREHLASPRQLAGAICQLMWFAADGAGETGRKCGAFRPANTGTGNDVRKGGSAGIGRFLFAVGNGNGELGGWVRPRLTMFSALALEEWVNM